MILRRTCRQIAAALMAREDRALPANDAVAMRLHMLGCGHCRNFEQQVAMMRKALRQWRDDTEEPRLS
jgi:predicted anti-sigma-YlaC factor YlaD